MRKRRVRIIAAITTAFYVAGIIGAVHAVMTTRTPQGAIAWSVSLVSFPFVAVPAYLVFGRSKFEGMVEVYEDRKDEIDQGLTRIYKNLEPWGVPSNRRTGSYRAVRELSRMQLVSGNHAKLLINGDATFDDIIAGIAAAKDYALVQFYMFHDDGLGRRMKEAMIERAKAGVRVYMLYDEVGSKGLPTSYIDELRAAGVEVTSFKPTQGRSNRFQLNFRNHRKMVVVDGLVGWVGGHNVGDEYLGLDPDFSPWRDTHVRLEGPVVMQLQTVILGDWYWATREFPQVNIEPQAAEGGEVEAMIFPGAPSQRLENMGLFFVASLNVAKDRIWLSAPYFVPDEGVMKALELAALRGVDVRIITSGKSDNPIVGLAAYYYMDQLRDLGIKFYAFTPGFLHEKVVLIDDDISAVGTANFDNRSFRLNFEVMALISDRAFALEMEKMFEADFEHSIVIDPNKFDEKSFWWKLGVNLSRLTSPVL